MTSRKDIFHKKSVYGWSAKVDFTLGHGGGIHELNHLFEQVPGEPFRAQALASLLWNQDYILTLESRKLHDFQQGGGLKGFRLTVHAEDTACGAESLGTRLAYALLTIAIERRWGMALAWPDSPLPCRVIDRNVSSGFTGSAFATVTSYMYMKDFLPKLEDGFAKHVDVPYRLLWSMELVVSSRLESNSRSKLVMLTSALEALADQHDLSEHVGELVARLVDVVDQSEIGDASLKNSIVGQVRNLRRESSRRAVNRLVLESGMAAEDAEFVEKAYSTRSKIVHEGKRIPELDAMVHRLEEVLIRLYGIL